MLILVIKLIFYMGIGIINALYQGFKCSHQRITVAEGKSYCPDCGQPVLFEWRQLHCGGCSRKRAGIYRLSRLQPVDAWCRYCGTPETIATVLHQPDYFQVQQAVLCFREEQPTQYKLLDSDKLWNNCVEWVKRNIERLYYYADTGLESPAFAPTPCLPST